MATNLPLFRSVMVAILLATGSTFARPQAAPSANVDPGFGDRSGSTNVPMDSWIYPALERLSTMGFIPTQTVAIRPWTRQECLRQLREAQALLHDYDIPDSLKLEAERLLPDLDQALDQPEPPGLVLESVYTRYGVIAGPALTDGFHFGQTWWNDFGRPLQRGGSVIAGFSAHATHGRFFLYDRQELQSTPGTPALTAPTAQLFNTLDNIPFGSPVIPAPFPLTAATAAALRQRPLELYAGAAFAGNAVSFGKQQIFWGPTTMGPLSFSANAEPTYNLRIVSTRPHPIPFFPGLGTYRLDLVFGKLSGHHYPARPFFNGQKFDLNLAGHLEMSVTRWSILWGAGHPITLRSLKNNLFSTNSTSNAGAASYLYGDRTDPGDRKSDFDFRLHVPGLERYVTLYADAYSDDELNPLDAPRRAVWAPGIYLAQLPFLPHMDLRLEMTSPEELARDEGGSRFFINNQYRDGNTNKGFLLGNATGRDARAFEARAGFWFSPRTRAELGLRQQKGGLSFLPGGSTISDVFLNSSFALSPEWSANLFAQHERFLIPAFLPAPHTNNSGWLQLTWTPNLHLPRQ